jgi:hypothetical protein
LGIRVGGGNAPKFPAFIEGCSQHDLEGGTRVPPTVNSISWRVAPVAKLKAETCIIHV